MEIMEGPGMLIIEAMCVHHALMMIISINSLH